MQESCHDFFAFTLYAIPGADHADDANLPACGFLKYPGDVLAAANNGSALYPQRRSPQALPVVTSLPPHEDLPPEMAGFAVLSDRSR